MNGILTTLTGIFIVGIAATPFYLGWRGDPRFWRMENLYTWLISGLALSIMAIESAFRYGADLQLKEIQVISGQSFTPIDPLIDPVYKLWAFALLGAYAVALILFKILIFEEVKGPTDKADEQA